MSSFLFNINYFIEMDKYSLMFSFRAMLCHILISTSNILFFWDSMFQQFLSLTSKLLFLYNLRNSILIVLLLCPVFVTAHTQSTNTVYIHTLRIQDSIALFGYFESCDSPLSGIACEYLRLSILSSILNVPLLFHSVVYVWNSPRSVFMSR